MPSQGPSAIRIVRLLLRDQRLRWQQFKRRAALARMGLLCSRNSIVNSPELSRIAVGKGCNLSDFAIIDISDDPLPGGETARLELGDYVYIGDHCNIRASGSTVRIGNGTMIANSVVIVSANHGTERGTPLNLQPWDRTRTGVRIGADCWLGSNCTILPGSVIGDGVVVAAGAVVRGTIPPYTIWGGVPAKFIKNRE